METTFDWERLVSLQQEGKIPPALLERWHERTGTNLTELMKTWRENERLRKRVLKPLDAITSYAAAGVFGSFFFVLLAFADERATALTPVFAGMVAVSAFAWLAAALIKRPYDRLVYDRDDCDYRFVYHYHNLLTWAGADPERVAKMHLHELEQLATGILVTAAGQVLLSQEADPYPGHMSEERRGLVDDFEYKHDTLRDLGLLRKVGYGPYYQGAERMIHGALEHI